MGLPGWPAEPALAPFHDELNIFIKHPLREPTTLPFRRYQCDGTINTQAQTTYRSLRDTYNTKINILRQIHTVETEC